VSLDRSAGLFGDERLRRVEPGQIGRSARRVIEVDAQHGVGFMKELSALARNCAVSGVIDRRLQGGFRA
jgi:hypothetical protein